MAGAYGQQGAPGGKGGAMAQPMRGGSQGAPGGALGGQQPYNMQQNGAYGTASQGLTDAMNMTAGVGAQDPAQRAKFARTSGTQRANLERTGGAVTANNRDLRDANINRYMNPYEDAVIDQSTQDLNRARQIAMNDVGAQASAAGAFGGDRHGIVEAETNRNFADSAARMASGLRQQGFERSQDMANMDIDRDFSRSMFNTNARNANRQFNANSANANRQFNANAVNANRQFNALGANANRQFNANAVNANRQFMGGQQLAAAGLLGGLANQSFNTGRQINQDQLMQGGLQQQLMQQIIGGGNQQYNAWANQPANALQLPLQALGMTPYGSTTTQESTSNPGFFDYLTAGLSAATAL